MKLLVADDHVLLRDGMIAALAELAGPDARYLEATDAAQVLRLIGEHPDLDLILLDLMMPGANGFELLSRVCTTLPAVPVVVISASEDPAWMRKSFDCGASGFIVKSAGRELMLSAVRLVLAGGVYMPPELVLTQPARAEGAAVEVSRPMSTSASAPASLTPRQREVLELLENGHSNKQIARILGLSQHTVKIHVAAILRKLDAANRTAAVALARRSDPGPDELDPAESARAGPEVADPRADPA
ncbi:MAG: response regulator transcription factor [Sphingobacteriia bacterium]|nr:response regulator transcription factor [Sphingobacteriia bacterium]NCC39755.1 response regulator transcription factor [Gammaproteobacteria bacterium]